MSRIQDILDKAAREGATFRLQDMEIGSTSVAVPVPPIAVPPMPAARPAPPASQPTFVPDRRVAAATADAIARVTAERRQVRRPVRSIAGTLLDSRLVTAASKDRPVIEQYRALRTRIANADTSARVGVLLVTSAGRGDGKTLTVANLALSMAGETQRRVCLVDANLRNPQVHRLFGLSDGPGLCDVLAGTATLDEALVTLEDHRLTILPAGHVPDNPGELLGTSTMRRTMDELRASFDRTLVDAPGLLASADVGILNSMIDKVLLVVRAGVTPKPALHDAVSSLDAGKLLGVVLNEAA